MAIEMTAAFGRGDTLRQRAVRVPGRCSRRTRTPDVGKGRDHRHDGSDGSPAPGREHRGKVLTATIRRQADHQEGCSRMKSVLSSIRWIQEDTGRGRGTASRGPSSCRKSESAIRRPEEMREREGETEHAGDVDGQDAIATTERRPRGTDPCCVIGRAHRRLTRMTEGIASPGEGEREAFRQGLPARRGGA